MTLAILTIIGGLITLVTWFTRRKWVPTLDERIDDLNQEYEDTTENVHRLRSMGNHAAAEAMLSRMRNRAYVKRADDDKLRNDQPT